MTTITGEHSQPASIGRMQTRPGLCKARTTQMASGLPTPWHCRHRLKTKKILRFKIFSNVSAHRQPLFWFFQGKPCVDDDDNDNGNSNDANGAGIKEMVMMIISLIMIELIALSNPFRKAVWSALRRKSEGKNISPLLSGLARELPGTLVNFLRF